MKLDGEGGEMRDKLKFGPLWVFRLPSFLGPSIPLVRVSSLLSFQFF